MDFDGAPEAVGRGNSTNLSIPADWIKTLAPISEAIFVAQSGDRALRSAAERLDKVTLNLK